MAAKDPAKFANAHRGASERTFAERKLPESACKVTFAFQARSIKPLTRKTNMPDDQHLKDEEIAKSYSSKLGLPYVRIKDLAIPEKVFSLIPLNIIKSYKVLPFALEGGETKTLKIAAADPLKLQEKAPQAILDLKNKGFNIVIVITSLGDFEEALSRFTQERVESSEHLSTKLEAGRADSGEEGKKESVQIVPISKPTLTANQNISSNKPAITGNEVSLFNRKIPQDVLNKIPQEVAVKYKIVVFDCADNKIKIAALHPDDAALEEILKFIKEKNKIKIEVYKTNQNDLNYAFTLYQQKRPINRGFFTPTDKQEDQVSQSASVGIPLASPLPDVGKSTPVPTLDINKKSGTNLVKNIHLVQEKPQQDKFADSEDVEKELVKKDQERIVLPSLASAEEDENNLDLLISEGIANNDQLKSIIAGGIIPKIVAAIIYYAVKLESSDIHLEPAEKDFRLRYRIDGILQDILVLPQELQAPVVSRVKIMAKLRIDEQRIPQDGRFDVISDQKNIDLRISTLPTVHGEKVVMRLLDKSSGVKKLEDLGFNGTNLTRINENISRPHGIILATGPTGSGKSTTLYAILNKISSAAVNIITLEDPVEYEINGINQCQIKPKIGFGFAEGLRSILRQDPDIIMVGEIRDGETASMATHAALTGHLVLSTLHTNDAAGALPRLVNMGVEPFLITSSINCIIAQRLVRKICSHCKEEIQLPEPVVEEIKKEFRESRNKEALEYLNKPMRFYRGKGCNLCNKGYKGRVGIYEVLLVSAEIENLAVHKAPANKINEQAINDGMITLKQDGLIKVINGITTIDEVMRVTLGE